MVKLTLRKIFLPVLFGAMVTSAAWGQEIRVPSLWDPNHRLERPDLSALRLIRFITEDDYPPFEFALPDGTLAGFNVELARALCEELRVQCTVQPRRWDTILDAIEQGRGDAAISSLAITTANRARVSFTAPYYKTPARFIARQDFELNDVTPAALAGKQVGVVARTAHEAYLRQFFPQVTLRPYQTLASLRSALKREEVDLVFGDGVSFAIWLNSTDASACCAFRGGAFTEARFFGEGVGIAVRKDNHGLRRALDYALKRVAERGIYAELYLKYFPISFY